MKVQLSIVCLITALCLQALGDDKQIAESARLLLHDAAAKPFPEFARITKATVLHELPPPGFEKSSVLMTSIRNLLWERISTLDLTVTESNKQEQLANLTALCELRAWLLKHSSYSNLVLAAFVDESVSIATLAALSQGIISADEAGGICSPLAPRIPAKLIYDIVRRYVPNSRSLEQFSRTPPQDRAGSLIDLAEELSNERNELLDTRPIMLMSSIRPASLMLYAAEASGTSHMATELVAYASKGGNLNADAVAFRADVSKRSPDIIGKVDPGSLVKLDAAMFAALMENVREWTSKH